MAPRVSLDDAKWHGWRWRESPTHVMKGVCVCASGWLVNHVHRGGQVQSGQQSSLSPETQFKLSFSFSRPYFRTRPSWVAGSQSSPVSCRSHCWCADPSSPHTWSEGRQLGLLGCSHCQAAAAPQLETSRLFPGTQRTTPGTRQGQRTRTDLSSRRRSCASSSGGRRSSACAGTSGRTSSTWTRSPSRTRTSGVGSGCSSSRRIAARGDS